ncbi:MAG: hypothetical protein MPJ50_09840 [Pirellulales bacterium]|nr:hypothetical protein [Pirellulales bacterium]
MSEKQRFRRQNLWGDVGIQRTIILRLLTYYLACGITATCLLVAWRVAVHGSQMGLQGHLAVLWSQLGPGALSLVLLSPIVVFDAIRLSHRFTGQITRIRKTMQAAVEGKRVDPVKLRETDHWQDLADDLNRLLARFDALRSGAEGDTNDADDAEADLTLKSARDVRDAVQKAARQGKSPGAQSHGAQSSVVKQAE